MGDSLLGGCCDAHWAAKHHLRGGRYSTVLAAVHLKQQEKGVQTRGSAQGHTFPVKAVVMELCWFWGRGQLVIKASESSVRREQVDPRGALELGA